MTFPQPATGISILDWPEQNHTSPTITFFNCNFLPSVNVNVLKSCIYPPTVRERAERVQESQTVQFHGIRYVYYLQAMHVNVQAHIKENLRKAFTAREIQIFMQPQVCLKDGAICAAQAFPYWLQPDGSWNLPLRRVAAENEKRKSPVYGE